MAHATVAQCLLVCTLTERGGRLRTCCEAFVSGEWKLFLCPCLLSRVCFESFSLCLFVCFFKSSFLIQAVSNVNITLLQCLFCCFA